MSTPLHTTLQQLHGESIIAVQFPNTTALNQRFRQLPGARWSNSLKCWYLPDTAAYRKRFGLEGDPAVIKANSALQRQPVIRQNIVMATRPPLTTAQIAKPPLFRQNEFVVVVPQRIVLPTTGSIPSVNAGVLHRVQQHLVLKAYSQSTRRTYLNEIAQLLKLLGNVPAESLGPADLIRYFVYCFEKLRLSENTLHSRINALKFYYEQVLGREKFFWEIPRPKKQMMLPRFFNQDEIAAIINAVDNLKHKAMLMLAYSSGLRVSEVVNIKTCHIDSNRMCILVEQAKGKKDRMVNLSPVLLVMLREYWKAYKPPPKGYLFMGQNRDEAYSTRSLQLVLEAAKARAGIHKAGSVHALRHSFATHLLDKGSDVTMIMKLLGHNDIKTTLRYLHVTNRDVLQVVSPLDSLNLK